ncbi:MAG: hypothetical protein ABIQ40_04225 [Bacteroidia bacterium]
MNSNLQNGKTIESFLAAKKSNVRKKQIAELDKYVQERRKEKKKNLRFITYWGASDKKYPDKYDYDALINLFGFLRIVEKHYKIDAQLTFIFTDTHVLLNGYKPEDYKSYFKGIRQVINEFNYTHVLMSEVLMPFAKSHHLKDMNALINSIITESSKYDIPEYLKGRESFELLKKSANKHSYRYYNNQIFGDLRFDSTGQSAYAYITLNQIEKQYVEKNFFQNVFLTYTSDEEKELIAPNLPSLQIYSFSKGQRSRPWFSNSNNKATK